MAASGDVGKQGGGFFPEKAKPNPDWLTRRHEDVVPSRRVYRPTSVGASSMSDDSTGRGLFVSSVNQNFYYCGQNLSARNENRTL